MDQTKREKKMKKYLYITGDMYHNIVVTANIFVETNLYGIE